MKHQPHDHSDCIEAQFLPHSRGVIHFQDLSRHQKHNPKRKVPAVLRQKKTTFLVGNSLNSQFLHSVDANESSVDIFSTETALDIQCLKMNYSTF